MNCSIQIAAIKDRVRAMLGREPVNGLRHADRETLAHRPRRTSGSVDLFGCTIHYCDARSFLSTHAEIFGRRIYAFEPSTKAPCIVDAGANLGLASIFLKRRFPQASITAIEADPEIYRMLCQNFEACGFGDIETHHAAIWDSDGEVAFASEQSDAGHVSDTGGARIPARRLARFIAGRSIDLLKIDIEGAETRVLQDAAHDLGGVKRIFVEYHSRTDAPQSLGQVLDLLRTAGFRYYTETATVFRRQPFMPDVPREGFDQLVNIYAKRTSQNGAGGAPSEH